MIWGHNYCKAFCRKYFFVLHDIQTSANNLNKGLERISNWATQWKIKFNPNTAKQAQEVIFSRKVKKTVHPTLLFNNASVTRTFGNRTWESVKVRRPYKNDV